MKQSRFTVGQIIKALKENEQDCTEVSDTKSDTLNPESDIFNFLRFITFGE